MRWAEVSAPALDLTRTLQSGQAFRWVQGASGDWVGAIGPVAARLRPAVGGFFWQTYPTPDRWDVLERYLALEVDLAELRERWIRCDARVRPALDRCGGLRILRQDPLEAIFGFACACANTVAKVSRSVSSLAARYGRLVAEVDGVRVHEFPGLAALAEADEQALRRDLWGFRAPRVPGLARELAARGPGWMERLGGMDYRGAHEELVALHGIGPKIADCICLFGLGHDAAVPLDTHVHRAAVRLVAPDLTGRALTARVYHEIGERFRAKFGAHSGWLQQALFWDEMHRSPQSA